MTFSKWVFAVAGVWGVLVVPPLYFLFDTVGRMNPPAVTHPEFYYGFIAVTLAWQLAFFVIASDPARFRLLMLPAICEKMLYVATLVTLSIQGRIATSQLPFGAVDFLLGALFIAAYLRTKSA
jgi:hypothetical protein